METIKVVLGGGLFALGMVLACEAEGPTEQPSLESRTPDIGCLKMSASPEVQPPGLQSTGLRRCACLKKADRFGSAPSRTSECANRPQITEKSTGLCQEFWYL